MGYEGFDLQKDLEVLLERYSGNVDLLASLLEGSKKEGKITLFDYRAALCLYRQIVEIEYTVYSKQTGIECDAQSAGAKEIRERMETILVTLSMIE